MKKNILTILVLFVILAGGFLYYMGVFQPIRVEEMEIGPYALLYKEQRGDYGQTRKSIEEVTAALKELNLQPQHGFGIYYDDPKTVKKEDLRSEAGIILRTTDVSLVDRLKGRFKFKDYSRQKSIVAEFPFHNSLSIFVGIFKVYPAMAKYAEEKGYKNASSFEIYDYGKTITYSMPITH